MNPFARFFQGVGFYFKGFGLLARYPGLFALALTPILLTIVVLLGLAGGSAWLIGRWLQGSQLVNADGQWLLQMLVFLLALFVMYLLYLPLTRVFLAPLSEKLSRKTSELTGASAQAKHELGFFKSIWEGAKLVVFQLALVVMVLVLTILLPPVGVPLGICVTICFCGIDFLDVPLSMRGLSLRQKLRYLWHSRARVLGFALTGYLLLHIPIFNLLVLPIGVIGATLLINEVNRET
jgi:CysZ protein